MGRMGRRRTPRCEKGKVGWKMFCLDCEILLRTRYGLVLSTAMDEIKKNQ